MFSSENGHVELFIFSFLFMLFFLLSILGSMKVSKDPEKNSKITLYVVYIFTSIAFVLFIAAFVNFFLSLIGIPVNFVS